MLVPRTICILLLAVATNACATASIAQVSPETVSVPVVPAPDSVKPPPAPVVEAGPNFILTPKNVRLVISVNARRLWVVAGSDTLRTAPVSVASGRDLLYGGRKWRFATPRGRMIIKGKRTDPVWLPPDWHYAEVARDHSLKLRQFVSGTRLRNGDRLMLRDSVIGLVKQGDTTFLALPTAEHIVFDSTLFIPPLASLNRRLHGELGDYALDLGDGYMLHGTADQMTIGTDKTHGCIRLADRDLAWLYTYVPVGVTVVVR